MNVSSSSSELVPMHPAFRFQRVCLAICIVLAPLALSLYAISWKGYLRDPLMESAMAGSTGNTLPLIGAITSSFLLPLGFLGMSMLGMRRAPWLATISVVLSLIGWIPWAALMGLDVLAYDIHRIGSSSQLTALWTTFNGDAVMMTYLLIYIIGHLLSAMLIGFMLGRLRLIPIWAAWAFALTSPLNMLLFPIHTVVLQDALKYLLGALLMIGAIPAAFAMLTNKDLKQPAPSQAQSLTEASDHSSEAGDDRPLEKRPLKHAL